MTVEQFQQQVYPNLGPANKVGYNGTAPGPLFVVERGTETIVRVYNKGNGDAVMHLHGSYTHSTWDGWAEDGISVGQYKDYYYPNSENARSIWMHDHLHKNTATNAYFGQAGVYLIHDPAEDALGLPSGKYDVPLALSDKTYQANGDLVSPEGAIINFYGDVIHVNEQPWPYLQVEPRKYRFRIYDMSLSRPYDLYFQTPSAQTIPFKVIASDSGLFGAPVDTSDVVISMGERYEIVVDFAAYKGQNITLKNGMQQGQINEFGNTDKVMLFVVGDAVSDSTNNGDVPGTLNPNIQWPAPRSVVDHKFNFQMGGDDTWTINGIGFDNINNRVLARPPQGTVELWEVRHTGGPAVHPVHIHLVNMQIVSRTGGNRGLLPYETAGLKDTVLLVPGETVQILAYYGPWDGIYMFHCHNLVHEDHTMMAAMNISLLQELGYDFDSAIGFADPRDARFAARDYSPAAFAPAGISSAVASLASLNPYAAAQSYMQAQHDYYATAGYHGETLPVTNTATLPPQSSGVGFATTTLTPTTVAPTVAQPTTTPAPKKKQRKHRGGRRAS